MSHFPDMQGGRPTMRRKSSAQNLLSSFKSNPGGASGPPVAIGPLPSATALSFASAASGVSTPTRELDALSLHSDSLSLGGVGSPQLGSGTSAEYLRDLTQKRIITLTYIRNIHEGRSHWFHTVLISRADLEREFNNFNPELKKRTYRFTILGMSLSTLLDIHQPPDFLRGLMNIVTEYEQNKEEGEKPRMQRLFKPGKNAKRMGGITEYTSSFSEISGDTSYLMTPHIPFPLDYHQVLLSLLDILSEVYNKISKILGPSPFPHSSQQMMGPLGMLTPHPGISYIFQSENPTTANVTSPGQASIPPSDVQIGDSISNALWNIAHPPGPSGSFMHGGVLGSPPPTWTPVLGDMILKIDGKIKKITSTLLKELDSFARQSIKRELALLDPLLSSTGLGGKGGWDFDT